MQKISRLTFVGLIASLFLVACATAEPEMKVTEILNNGRIVMGDISNDAYETTQEDQPMIDYLASQLGNFGIQRGEVVVAPDLGSMIRSLQSGNVDIYFDSPFPVVVMQREAGGELILRRHKDGGAEYSSVFFVPVDSPINSTADFPGSRIAFEEEFSTSGYMLPLAFLIENELNPAYYVDPGTPINPSETGFVYSLDDETTVEWVLSDVADMGVVDNVTFDNLPADIKSQLRIVAETEKVPRQIVLLRDGLDTNLTQAVEATLLAMDENPEGQAVLAAFDTAMYDDFPNADQDLARMYEMYELIQSFVEAQQ